MILFKPGLPGLFLAAAGMCLFLSGISCTGISGVEEDRRRTDTVESKEDLPRSDDELRPDPPMPGAERERMFHKIRYSDISSRPANIRGDLYRPPARDWKYIVIHHSGTSGGSMSSFDRHARENRGWRGVGYHFVIGNGTGTGDGVVEVTFRWEDQIHGAHAGVEEFNEYGIGICLVGDFNSGQPTLKQMKALAELTNYLLDVNDIPVSEIYLHRHLKNTQCPGKDFPFYEFISLLQR